MYNNVCAYCIHFYGALASERHLSSYFRCSKLKKKEPLAYFMSRIFASVCPHMSRNFVSVCPHMSRIFVSVCPHMSRNFVSVCPHMSRNVAHIYVYSFSVPVSQIVCIFDVPVSQQPDFVQKLCLFGLKLI